MPKDTVKAVEDHIALFSEPLHAYAYDRAGHSEKNVQRLKELGVKEVGLAPRWFGSETAERGWKLYQPREPRAARKGLTPEPEVGRLIGAKALAQFGLAIEAALQEIAAAPNDSQFRSHSEGNAIRLDSPLCRE